jgi:hypothetical protein
MNKYYYNIVNTHKTNCGVFVPEIYFDLHTAMYIYLKKIYDDPKKALGTQFFDKNLYNNNQYGGDYNSNVIEGDIEYVGSNQIKVTLSEPSIGYAYLS